MDSTKKPNKEHPREHAGKLSQLFYIWAMKLLYKGFRKGLTVRDLTKCRKIDDSHDLGDKLEFYWLQEVERANAKNRKPNFSKVIAKTFWTSFIFDGIMTLIHVFIRSAAPLIVAQILLKIQDSKSTLGTKSLYNMNVNLTTNISVQQLKTNGTNNQHHTKVTWSTIWNDVNWLCGLLAFAHTLACLLHHQAELRQRLLTARIRVACCSLIYRKMLRLSKRISGNIRIGYIINLISNDAGRIDLGFCYIHYIWVLPLQVILICFLTWPDFGISSIIGVLVLVSLTVPVQTGISRIVSKLRGKIATKTDKRIGVMNELVQGVQVIKMYAWEKPFEKIVAETRRLEIRQIRFASYLRGFFTSSVIFVEKITLFVTTICLVALDKYATPDLIFSISQYFGALRLTSSIFYPLAITFGAEAVVSIHRLEEFLLLEEHKRKVEGITYYKKTLQKDMYSVTINKVFASWNDDSATLSDINLNVKAGTLCAVIGSVGAGKSSVLHLLLKELPITSGKVEVFGALSYASQEPWIFSGTVRSNILFSEKFLPKKYNAVTKCCALVRDFAQLPKGDRTFVSEKGAGLSGGQRARISLARAVYRQASIYLMDDPLSAVDTHVGRHLFDEVIGPNGYLAKENATRILITHQVHFLTDAEWIVILENGKIAHQGTFEDLAKNDDIDIFKFTDKPPNSEPPETENGQANGLGLAKRDTIDAVKSESSVDLFEAHEKDEEPIPDEEIGGKGSGIVWRNYLHAGCRYSFCLLAAFVVLLLFSQMIISGIDFFVNIFSQQEFNRLNGLPLLLDLKELFIIYSCLIVVVIFITILRSFLVFNMCMRASTELHNRMFKNILHATMRFFDINPSGRILNRFSRDMGVVDEFLPRTLMDCIQVILLTLGILVLVSILNPYLVIALCIALFLYYVIFRLYVRTSLDLKRLETMCKSPVFSHTASSLAGVSTIRAKNLEKIVASEFDSLQNVHSALWSSTMAVNTALGLWIDFVSCACIAAVSYSFTISNGDNINSASVGLAISQSVILSNMVQYGIKQIAEALQWMTSTERIVQYNYIDQEPDIKRYPPKYWPLYGRIEFRHTSLSYDKNLPPTLRNLQFVVEPAWKVGIVGRTGAGKSSLINALFRLSPIEGEIYIDNIETGSISLSYLRSCISIIPQNPVLFSESLRYNLDPFGKYSDAAIHQSLEDVELKLSLDFIVSEGGANFSAGQRQLICLARSILRNNKIMVLDEATANVDPQTDALIQKTIRNKFKQCSVLTIAHRLHTIIDSDRVLVMDFGSVAEYDHPHLLLLDSKGIFRNMVDATGPTDSSNLKAIAEETYKQKTL